MKDAHGTTIKPGSTLKRVVDGSATSVGYEYQVIQCDFDNDTEGDDLVADGGFIKELITAENSKEFEVV